MTSQPGSESWKSNERRFELFAFAAVTILMDGEVVATSAIDAGWIEAVDENDLRLLVGNGQARTLPFHGVIQWIEVDT